MVQFLESIPLGLAMRGFSYGDTESARAYLREVGKTVLIDVEDEREAVEAFIRWERQNLRLQD